MQRACAFVRRMCKACITAKRALLQTVGRSVVGGVAEAAIAAKVGAAARAAAAGGGAAATVEGENKISVIIATGTGHEDSSSSRPPRDPALGGRRHVVHTSISRVVHASSSHTKLRAVRSGAGVSMGRPCASGGVLSASCASRQAECTRGHVCAASERGMRRQRR